MTETPESAGELVAQVFGSVPAVPGALEQLLRLLESLPIDHAQKKYVLLLWLSRAEVPLEAWMVGRLGGE